MGSARTRSSYSEHDIKVLRGLEPVQKRPGMYTNTESPNHIMAEVVDNAQDEALAGYATQITVTAHSDGSISVQDNGRGIPVGMHPEEKRPAVEVIFTTLHSGGKFENGGAKAYGFTGGLHGVGVSVTNALSRRLEVTVWRDNYRYALAFEHGLLVEPLSRTKVPPEEAGRLGTRIHAWPDPQYFESPEINLNEFERYLRSKAALMGGVELVWERPGRPPKVWSFADGLKQYMREAVGEEAPWVTDLWSAALFHPEGISGFEPGEGCDVALGWLADGRCIRESFVNLIPTLQGGRHETGLRAGLFEAIKALTEHAVSLPKNLKLEPEDVWSRLAFVLSVKLQDPQFKNQTKDKMTSPKGHTLVAGLVKDSFELWLHDHPEQAKAIIEAVVSEAQRRTADTVKIDRKRVGSAAVLPGKLTDCESKDVAVTELFLVEGDSAGGSSKQGRDRVRQAILPLRGKLLNTWEVEASRIATSETVGNIAAAIGVDPHPGQTAAEVDLSKLRYGKVFIMADADVDGRHIQVLLLTLFLKHFPALLERGVIWIAQSPLFRLDAPQKRGSKDGPRKMYALDEHELTTFERQLQKEGLKETQWSVARFKGLGEMNPGQLWETTMNPDSRRALQMTVSDVEQLHATFNMLMGGKNASMRCEWMEREGGTIDVDV